MLKMKVERNLNEANMNAAIKKKKVVKRRKQIRKSRVKQLLEEQGKSDQWLIDILKSKFDIKESETRGLISGRTGLSIINHTVGLICVVLKIKFCYMFRNCK